MWFFFFLPLLLHAEITALYLSWYDDPTTTMTIQWHTPFKELGDTIYLSDGQEWAAINGTHIHLDQVLVHSAALDHLQPNTEYSFYIGSDPKVYKFRTAPANLDEPLRFLVGGDIYLNRRIFQYMGKTVLKNDPRFIVLGGDIAYALGGPRFHSSLRQWLDFLKDWMTHMIRKDGLIIPFLIVPGNHDIAADNYETFFSLFAFPQKRLYRTVDFGSYLSLILLDTGHFHQIEHQQTLWLDKALSARTSIPYRFAIYHEAAYPSFYPYLDPTPKKIRTFWVPLFEKYKISAAFENHNHTFKRTYPIKANQIDPEGIVYIGDGSWGVLPRRVNDTWYLAKKLRKNSVLLVELNAEKAAVQAIGISNNLLDTVEISAH